MEWLLVGFLIYASHATTIEVKSFQSERACMEYGKAWVKHHKHSDFICEGREYVNINTANL